VLERLLRPASFFSFLGGYLLQVEGGSGRARGRHDFCPHESGLGCRQAARKIIGIPKTMDNGVRNTEYCIGVSTAITRAADEIQRRRTPSPSCPATHLREVHGAGR
jgi:6-phosphofructokinase